MAVAIPAPLVVLRHVTKCFRVGDADVAVLKGIVVEVRAGELVAITGPSGNGKSTLLNMITAIDRPSAGEVIVGGRAVHALSEEQLAAWRNEAVGIVFQFFQLLPALSLLQNVVLPMDFARRLAPRQRRERALHLLELVGLADQAHKLPSRVSGGQQQRAAIARALANDPPLVVADEPTGNLDAQMAEEVFSLFTRLVAGGKTVIMVTHNEELARRAHRVLRLRNGELVADERPALAEELGGARGGQALPEVAPQGGARGGLALPERDRP